MVKELYQTHLQCSKKKLESKEARMMNEIEDESNEDQWIV